MNSQKILSVFEDFISNLSYQTYFINERYIHHSLSSQLQRELGGIDLGGTRELILLHPEWPTYKKVPDKCNYAKYSRNDSTKKYQKNNSGGSGFIDFALGAYLRPQIGVEITAKRGWNGEEIIFDLIKLLDSASPFETIFSINIIYRDNRLPPGGHEVRLKNKIDQLLPHTRERIGSLKDINKHVEIIEISQINGIRRWSLKDNYFVKSVLTP